MTIITDVRLALLDQLQTILAANGYATSAGSNVRSGWFNEVIKEQPIGDGLIVLQRAPVATPPLAGDRAIKVSLAYSVVGAVEAGLDAYETAMEALEADLLFCLLPSEGERPRWLPAGCSGLEVGAPEVFPPGDGQAATTVLVPIKITAVISRQG